MIVLDVGFLSRLNICTINHNFIKQRAAFDFKLKLVFKKTTEVDTV